MKLIPLTRGKFAMVDDEDYEFLSQWKWHSHWEPRGKTFVAARSVRDSDGLPRGTMILMHRALAYDYAALEHHGEFANLNLPFVV